MAELMTRRRLLYTGGRAALGAAALVSRLGMVSAFAQGAGGSGDYKALVCIFLNGGNDAFNMVVPYAQSEYDYYAQVRPTVALARAGLLPISPASAGRQFGLHPNVPELAALWGQQKLAVLCNVGTLIAPTTKNEYRTNPLVRPRSLFDHSIQQESWQGFNDAIGWGNALGTIAQGLNDQARLPLLVNVAGGSAAYLAGTDPYITLPPGASLTLQGFTSSAQSTARYNALRQLLGLSDNAALVNVVSDKTARAIDDGKTASDALGSATITTVFPNTSLAKQLLQIAKIIKVRATLGQQRRQLFFASLGGFDTHATQNASQPGLMTTLSQSIKAFYDATVELGVSGNVTTFTLSEFGRTVQNSGDGTDHAWGSHALIVGDSVRGGDFYGAYPSLILGGADDVDTGTGARGRILPTTSVDQYAATLAAWYGLTSSEIQTVVPNLYRFAPVNLGFMAPA